MANGSSNDTETLVIGAGFAGLSVASALPQESVMVVDRGEPFDVAKAYAALELRNVPFQTGLLEPMVDAEARAMRSLIPGNDVNLPLSVFSVNVYSYMQGGISNWWGGYSARLTAETFKRDGVLAWPFELETLAPYYAEAEKRMRVHGDPEAADYTVYGPMPGWRLWRDYLKATFPRARVTPEAKNITDRDSGIGVCVGNGHCALCGNDAKMRPATTFPNVDVVGRSRIDELLFEGDRAVAARGVSDDGEAFSISFDRVVLAGGGLENVSLLQRSRLPSGVSKEIGSWYQDHTTCEILALMPDALPYYRLGAEGAVEIPELSGYFGDVEVKTLLLVTPPWREQAMEAMGEANNPDLKPEDVAATASRLGRFYLQMEIPPEWNLRVLSRDGQSFIDTLSYFRKLPLLDAAVLRIARKLGEHGVEVKRIYPHHRSAFGGHHYSGTTPMSRTDRAIVSPDQKLIGASNVYLNGASVMPRCGGSGPTLSIVALGLRLGDLLASRPG